MYKIKNIILTTNYVIFKFWKDECTCVNNSDYTGVQPIFKLQCLQKAYITNLYHSHYGKYIACVVVL